MLNSVVIDLQGWIRHMREVLEGSSESEWSRLADATALLEAALRGKRG